MSARHWGFGPVAIASLAVPLHVALALGTELSPDESYYLCAARAPGWLPPIADHPPLLIWLLRACDRLAFLPLELRVRLVAIGASFATSVAAAALARARGASEAGAKMTAAAMSFSLLAVAGGFVATPDAPFLLAFALLLLAVAAARPTPALVALAGFAALASKVSALPIVVVIAVTCSTPGVLAACGAAILLATPLVLPSLVFQLRHAFGPPAGGAPVVGPFVSVAAAAGAQVALWSPWLLAYGARETRTGPRVERWTALAITSLVLASGVVRGVPPEPNWWAPAALVLATAAARAKWSRLARMAAPLFWIATSGIASAHAFRPFLPIDRAHDPTARLHGWRAGEDEPTDAPGLGPYALSAERCIYRNDCADIQLMFSSHRPIHLIDYVRLHEPTKSR